MSENLFDHVDIDNGCSKQNRPNYLDVEKNILGRKCQFSIEFDEMFPSSLPKFRLKNVADFSLMPHVNSAGTMCLFDKDTILVDPFNPLGIVKACSERAFKIIKNGITQVNRDEIFQEFEAFLDGIPTCIIAQSLLSEMDIPTIVWSTNFEGKILFGDSKSQLRQFLEKVLQNQFSGNLKFKKALYVPLSEDEVSKMPLFGWKTWWQFPILRTVFGPAIKKHDIKWQSFLTNRKNSALPIVFKLSLPSGGSLHFGLTFKVDNSGIHPILRRRQDESCIPIKFQRMDKDYLLPRGGASANLYEKNVLLVGCGSVGSCIALNLAKSGIGKMTLIDNDYLKPENIYRHLLGMKDCLKPMAKSDLLKVQLESELPHCQIDSIVNTFQSVLKNDFDCSPFDLVILATGNDNLNIWVGEFFHEYYPQKPVMYSWLDPLGIGGHVLLTNLEQHGCYKCLFDRNLHNKASFANGDQSFSKTMAGCSGRFTNFGFLDVQETALLTVRLSIEVLQKEKTNNQLISWIGNDEKFILEGFKTSARYQKNAEKKRLVISDFADVSCPICGDSIRRNRIPTLKKWDAEDH